LLSAGGPLTARRIEQQTPARARTSVNEHVLVDGMGSADFTQEDRARFTGLIERMPFHS
jgi:hypothetical protein